MLPVPKKSTPSELEPTNTPAFWRDLRRWWVAGMTGGLTLPFVWVSVFWPDGLGGYARELFICLAAISLLVAAYTVWRAENERANKFSSELKSGRLYT